MSAASKKEERQRLVQLIKQWNVDHYDIFELSLPNEENQFHGVVRFFFQGGGANVVTKCIRVASDATTREVIDVLVEKFRPDMRMLTQNKYALYEVHVTGEERRLGDEEQPLLVQLNWGKDVREGRFLLKREDEATAKGATGDWDTDKAVDNQGFKRKLSKREKKEKKKRDKERNKENVDKADGVAEKLYNDLPETSFTRSISNPEAVMRRRRQQKLEKKLQQMRGPDGKPDSGGTLKIYGESVRPDIPYKTLLLSTADTTSYVIREAMEKYGLENQDPAQYCLVQVLVPPGGMEYHGGQMGEERIMAEDECPLAVVMQHPKNRGHMIFQLRHCPNNYPEPKKRTRAVSHDDLRYQHEPKPMNVDKLPYLQELNSRASKPKRHLLPYNVTEVGSDRSMSTSSQYLPLQGGDIKPRHCVVAHTEGIVTVTPTSRDAETYVEHQRIYETTMLKHGMTVQFGKTYMFRFCDPRFEDPHRHGPPEGAKQNYPYSRPQETNFDLDGHVETVGNGSPRSPGHGPRQPEWEDMQRRSAPDLKQGHPDLQHDGMDLLPASLEFRNNEESAVLSPVILDVNSRAVQFKLAPTYTLYMSVRHCLSPVKHPQLPPQHRAQRLGEFVNRISRMVQQAIQEHHNDPTALAFWMANASEILHFFKQDNDVHPFSQDAQELLAEAVQMAFQHLVRCLQVDLQRVMPAFLDPSNTEEEDEARDGNQQQFTSNKPILPDVLNTLSAAMTLLRRCRVNAALTIQLFSQLFHFINMWLFNILVTEPQLKLCTRWWGIVLKRRLGRIEAWAEKQGLELAADCHLCRIIQAAHLLQAPKSTSDDITNISSTCFKLNSVQLRILLSRYHPEPNEPPISPNFVERVVKIAENMADELTRTDGREVHLEEDQDLHLPFLLPEDGYSCDAVRGIPNGLPEFIKPLSNSAVCKLIPNNASNGSWTVYMGEGRPHEKSPPRGPVPGSQPHSVQPTQPIKRTPEIITVCFKKVNGSMGLSIVAAMGEGQRERGIYIKSVVPGGAAALDGRLQAGDQLLEVDSRNLVGLTQDKAAELMTRTGLTVTLKVAKQGAIYHGLATLLSQPSPTMQRSASTATPPKGPAPQMNNRSRPHGEEGPPPYNEVPPDGREQRDPTGRLFNEVPRNQPSPHQNHGPPRGRGEGPPHGDDRFRAPNSKGQPDHHRLDPNFSRRNMLEQDPRSKSTSNLHINNSFERDPHMMKPAASISALGPHGQGYPPVGKREDIPQQFGQKMNDYENQPHLNNLPSDKNLVETSKQGRGYPDINQNIVPGAKPGHYHSQPYLHPQQRLPNDRSSVSSRTSSSSNRENRPQSAYFDPHNREDFGQSRPKSDEITPNRIREWQEKLEEPRGLMRGNQQFHEQHSPNYSPGGPQNREPSMNTQQRPPNNHDIPKVTVSNQPRQPNFYENTMPNQHEALPPFHQLQRPSENEKPRPMTKPKPSVAPKPNQARVQPVEIPYNQVDNRQTQPQFYDPKPSPQATQSPQIFYNPHAGKQGGFQQGQRPQDSRASFGQKKYSPERQTGPYGYRDQEEMTLPMQNDVAPELPPPPSPEDLHEGSPPLPPPPAQDLMIEQQLQEEQRRLMNQIGIRSERPPNNQYNTSVDARYAGPAGYGGNEFDRQQMINAQDGRQEPDRQRMNGYPNERLQGMPPQMNNVHPNYQNINFSGPESQPPPIPQPPPEHNVYEPYEPVVNDGYQPPQRPGATHLTVQEKEYSLAASPWEREERERAQEKQEEELSRLREAEIADLESKAYLNPQEQDRLRKLRLEQEFQRRVKETIEDDDEEDSDPEMTERLYSRERMILVMKEDLEKSRSRMRDFERKRQIDEFEAERDRLSRLERRLQQFEKDREEHKMRMLKRQEKKQREHEEQLRQQREMREKQRQNFEEQKRLMMMEEEKIKQRREEELMKRRQYEREQQQERQAAREAEEAMLRAQIRQQEEEYSHQKLMQQRQERIDQQREIHVGEERRRIETANMQNQGAPFGYQQYANLPPQGGKETLNAPLPPQRNSSFDTVNQHQRQSLRNPDYQTVNFGRDQPPSAMRSAPENTAPKKSVSFNTQLETRNMYSITSDSDRSSHPSASSYRSSQGSQSDMSTPASYANQPPLPQGPNEVFDSPVHNNNTVDIRYVSSGTPNVVGAQEVYRDPRTRIEAQKAANSIKKQGPDRMSFRDKMKYFAQEAGENTIKHKAKASRTQRSIESQLNGQ